ncbi:hypothetical protein [Paludibacterium purpuratum]|uniref:Acid shock protein n=1 Tax=Paludibacterium purpuratum TaxID=1144873 RepID=A0A4V3DU86_9NEIS|nr:hypothetical protein [Paludibacterium purpuratum]TDR71642.1 hypothetical protein DFP86_11854 [Paludibacterium purpuratum]
MALKPFLTTLAASLLLCAASAALAEDTTPTDTPLPGDVQVSQPAASHHKIHKVQGSSNLVTADTGTKHRATHKKTASRKHAKHAAKRHGVTTGKPAAKKNKSTKAPVAHKAKTAHGKHVAKPARHGKPTPHKTAKTAKKVAHKKK